MLTRVDGRQLPAAVSLPSVFGSCMPQVLFGDLLVTAQVGDSYPSYSIASAAEPQVPPASCTGPFGSPNPQDFVRDAGRWSGDRSGIRFESRRDAGAYAVQVGDANGSPTLTASVRGHTLVFQRAWTSADDPVGVGFDVFDTAGARVKGAVVAISRRGLVVFRGAEFGYGFSWTVARGAPLTFAVTPPPGYAVAAGQPASVTVTPAADQRAVAVRFVLAPAP